jgi:RNA 2',3'-cyclic 3'-phosphodiesterase
VAKERLKSPRARLFTALDLPDSIAAALGVWQRQECGDPALRPVSAQGLHVTLCFLGWHSERAIGDVAAVVEGLEPRPVELRLEPKPVGIKGRRPGLYAVPAESPAAVALQGELSERLAAGRFYRPEQRPFWPHVTVARVKAERSQRGSSGRRRRGKPRLVEQPPGPLPDELLQPFRAVRAALYRSHLRSSGARYERLAALQLPPATSGRER